MVLVGYLRVADLRVVALMAASMDPEAVLKKCLNGAQHGGFGHSALGQIQ